MSPAATALLIALLNHGHWFGGEPGWVELRWSAQAGLPPATLLWRLELSGATLASARADLRPAPEATRITIVPPGVRVRTRMRWSYRLLRQEDGRLLEEGAREIDVYPRDLLAGLAPRLADRRLVVVDAADGLPRPLADAGIAAEVVARPGALKTLRADIVLVGPGRLGASPFAQSAAIEQARAGASVLIFAQTEPGHLAGYRLRRRAAPFRLAWRMDHPLLAAFTPADLESWANGTAAEAWAVELPADEPALEIAYWPRETPGKQPVPIDALLVARQLGSGRLVLCQLPVAPGADDPRGLLFLRSALDYLLTRPEPTPPPSQRAAESQPARPEGQQIPIRSGVDS